MSLLRKLFGGKEPLPAGSKGGGGEQPAPTRRFESQIYAGHMDLGVVGESHYQENLWQIVGKWRSPYERLRVEIHAVLLAEADNPYDENAISVWVNGLQVGHLSREDAQRYRPGLLALQTRSRNLIALRGVIVGGGVRDDGPGRLGVFLRFNPADFGMRAPRQWLAPGATMMTGLTDAILSDAADDSYDLSWMRTLPQEAVRAIPALRLLLEGEQDPIARHFMFLQLEEALYASREAFAPALDDYEEVCRRHDREMDAIRLAFMAKWGKVPWIHTYKQMCIRLAKSKRLEDALWWAERGIAVYAEDAARPDAVDDLHKRAATYRAKLAPSERRSRVRRMRSPETEALTCVECGLAFDRLRARGRKPKLCLECRERASHAEHIAKAP